MGEVGEIGPQHSEKEKEYVGKLVDGLVDEALAGPLDREKVRELIQDSHTFKGYEGDIGEGDLAREVVARFREDQRNRDKSLTDLGRSRLTHDWPTYQRIVNWASDILGEDNPMAGDRVREVRLLVEDMKLAADLRAVEQSSRTRGAGKLVRKILANPEPEVKGRIRDLKKLGWFFEEDPEARRRGWVKLRHPDQDQARYVEVSTSRFMREDTWKTDFE